VPNINPVQKWKTTFNSLHFERLHSAKMESDIEATSFQNVSPARGEAGN